MRRRNPHYNLTFYDVENYYHNDPYWVESYNKTRELYLFDKDLKDFDRLPVYLQTLCYRTTSTVFRTLPHPLPTYLEHFECSGHKIIQLPEHLPSTLTWLDCSDNKLRKLPELSHLPLCSLYCAKNKLTALPDVLPVTLTSISCYNNRLINLPENLPPKLKTLQCGNNKLTKLPDILPPHLREIKCKNNQLTYLPKLPRSVDHLDITNNQITLIPDLLSGPNEYCLRIDNNPLEENYPEIWKAEGVNRSYVLVEYINKCNAARRTGTQLPTLSEMYPRMFPTHHHTRHNQSG